MKKIENKEKYIQTTLWVGRDKIAATSSPPPELPPEELELKNKLDQLQQLFNQYHFWASNRSHKKYYWLNKAHSFAEDIII